MKSTIIYCFVLPFFPYAPPEATTCTCTGPKNDPVAHNGPNPIILNGNSLDSPNRIYVTEAEQVIRTQVPQTKGYRNEPTKAPWPTSNHPPPVDASPTGTTTLGQEVSKVPPHQ